MNRNYDQTFVLRRKSNIYLSVHAEQVVCAVAFVSDTLSTFYVAMAMVDVINPICMHILFQSKLAVVTLYLKSYYMVFKILRII